MRGGPVATLMATLNRLLYIVSDVLFIVVRRVPRGLENIRTVFR